jgi:Zn-dependent peptidase ImmA (M78 family)/transcriptional regulator with XRE-family HTH domain
MKDISTNLLRLRKAAGFSQSELATKAGISRLAYVNIETGKSVPKSDTLLSISQALKVGIFSVVQPIPTFKSLRFRSGITLSARQRALKEQEMITLAEWLQAYRELEAVLGDSRPYVLSSSSPSDPEQAAGHARNDLSVPNDSPIFDLPSLIASAGIKLYFLNAMIPGFSGASVGEQDGGPCIAVNKHGMSVERQIFTAAHELGHLLLHRESYGLQAEADSQLHRNQEKEADIFACFFLMPKELFKRRWNEDGGAHWINRVLAVKRFFRVSYQVVLFRLSEDKGSLPELHKNFALGYRRISGHDLKNHFEPDALVESMPLHEPEGIGRLDFCEERFRRFVRIALERDVISISRAAELLRIHLEEMRELRLSWLEEPGS